MTSKATLIAISPDAGGDWAVRAAGGAGTITSAVSFDDKASFAGQDVVLILPGENLRRLDLDLEGLRGAELKTAIDYELEDIVGGSISDELICRDRRNNKRVAVMGAGLGDLIKESLSEYNLSPSQIVVDYDLLGEGDAVKIGDRLIKGGVDGFAMNADWAGLLAEPPAFTPVTATELFERFNAGLQRDKSDAAMDLSYGLGLNASGHEGWQKWAKLAAACAALVLGPLMLNQYAQIKSWEAQTEQNKASLATMYQQATGDTPRGDIATLVKARLGSTQSSAGFLELSSVLFEAVKSVEGVEIESLIYDAKKTKLGVTLLYPNFETGAVMEKEISSRGAVLVAPGIREKNGRLASQGEIRFSANSGGAK